MASTFKPNSSLSSTDEINKKKDYKGLKSESEFLEASSHPKDSSTRPKWTSRPSPGTFSFTKISTASVCFTEQIFLAASIVTPSEVDCVNKKIPSWLPKLTNIPDSVLRYIWWMSVPMRAMVWENLFEKQRNPEILFLAESLQPREIEKGHMFILGHSHSWPSARLSCQESPNDQTIRFRIHVWAFQDIELTNL